MTTAKSTLKTRKVSHNDERNRKFLTLEDVQQVLAISSSQAYALVRSGDLRAIRVGGRGHWRVEETELEAYIARAYEATSVAKDRA